jgi:hypothetical protein
LEERIHDYKSKRYNHILRMNSSILTRKIKFYQPEGKGNTGRPRGRWKDNLGNGKG